MLASVRQHRTRTSGSSSKHAFSSQFNTSCAFDITIVRAIYLVADSLRLTSLNERGRPQRAQRRHELRGLAAAQCGLPSHDLERPYDLSLEATWQQGVVCAVCQLVHPRQDDVKEALLLQENRQNGDDLGRSGRGQLGKDGAGAAQQTNELQGKKGMVCESRMTGGIQVWKGPLQPVFHSEEESATVVKN